MDWLRLYTSITDDRKLRRLPPSYRWLWITILCCARRSPEPGVLLVTDGVPMTCEDLADAAAISDGDAADGLDDLEQLGMIHRDGDVWRVTNWDRYQYESDNSTERVRRHREKKRANTASTRRNGNETPVKRYSNVHVTPPDNRVQSTDVDDDDADTRARAREAAPAPESASRAAVIDAYYRNIEKTLTPRGDMRPMVVEELHRLIDELDGRQYGPELVIEAIREAAGANAKSLKYVSKVVETWRDAGIETPEDLALYREQQAARRQAAVGSGSGRAGPGRRRVPQGMASLAALYAQAKAEEEGQPHEIERGRAVGRDGRS